ncbi:MAG: hypothetical protein ACOC8J_17775, partial [Ralstonia sp.]
MATTRASGEAAAGCAEALGDDGQPVAPSGQLGGGAQLEQAALGFVQPAAANTVAFGTSSGV